MLLKIASTKYSDAAFNFATFILRIGAGSLMLVNHGISKMTNVGQMSNGFMNPFHIGSSTTLALVIFAEVFCSGLIILGLFTRLACIPLIFEMAFAFVKAHHMNWAAGQGGGEPSLLFLTCFLTLLFTGPGKVSVDRLIGK
jgi:putative oxidoreductase